MILLVKDVNGNVLADKSILFSTTNVRLERHESFRDSRVNSSYLRLFPVKFILFDPLRETNYKVYRTMFAKR